MVEVVKVSETMYKITDELIKDQGLNLEKDLKERQYTLYCKYFMEVLNALGIDETIFKDGNAYRFTEEAKGFVKNLISKHSEYKKLLKSKPLKRDEILLEELLENIEGLLKAEIKDTEQLYDHLSTIEFITEFKRNNLIKFLQSVAEPSKRWEVNIHDEIALSYYYMEELNLLKKKFETIRDNMIEIRNEEIYMNARRDVKNSNVDIDDKIKLDPLLIRKLLDGRNKGKPNVKEYYRWLSESLGLSEGEVKKEIIKFRNSKFTESKYFEKASTKKEVGEHSHPRIVIREAVNMYYDNLKDTGLTEISQEGLEAIKKLFPELDELIKKYSDLEE